METKDQLNQNPVDDNNKKQEENSQAEESTVKSEESVVNEATEEEQTETKPIAEAEEAVDKPREETPVDQTEVEPVSIKVDESLEPVKDADKPKEEAHEIAVAQEEEIAPVKEVPVEASVTSEEKAVEEKPKEEPVPEEDKESKVEETAIDKEEKKEVIAQEIAIAQEEEIAPIEEVPAEASVTSEEKAVEEKPKEEPVPEKEKKSKVEETTDKVETTVDKKEKESKVEETVDKGEAAIDKEEKKEVIVQETETSDKDVHEDDEEDDDIHDEDEHEEQVDYESLSLEELVSSLEEILKDGEVEKIKKNVALIKVAFLKQNKERQEKRFETFIAEGGDKEEYSQEKDDLEVRFQAAFQIYHDKRKQFLAEQEQIKQQNLDVKKLVLVELKALIESEESLKHTYDEFKILQEKWKHIGMVPKSEVNNLWQNYHFYVEKFFDKVKINKELRDLDMKKNMESKIELCEKAEELLLETSVLKSFKKLQQYHTEWKDIGPIPQDKKDEIWERFKTTTDKINDLRREHYNSLRDEQKKNLEAKIALCDKAEELLQLENTSIKEWQTNTDSISELLKIWKTIGQAPRQQNDEIWERFKTSLDTFFTGKKEYFQQIKDEQMNNYNMKLDLCTQAEAIKGNTDWKVTTHELINLQKEWKNIGPVPKRHSDKIWKRFRAACDEFFNKKSDYFGNIKQHEAENQKLKEEIINKVEGFDFGDDKNENLDVLKGFQREWTEIGHVPFKEKDRLQNTFRDAINKQFDKLKISRSEAQAVNYKQRFENIQENPNANRILYNERNFLATKRKKLEDEINLLENNMGFFAQSKKADLLKLELSKKIEKARSEVILINEKIKFLEREAK